MSQFLIKIAVGFALAGAASMLPTAASAQTRGPIVDDELADTQLHSIHGDIDVAVDGPERIDDFEATQSIAWVQLDNWFSEDGAEVISANIARESSSALLADF